MMSECLPSAKIPPSPNTTRKQQQQQQINNNNNNSTNQQINKSTTTTTTQQINKSTNQQQQQLNKSTNQQINNNKSTTTNQQHRLRCFTLEKTRRLPLHSNVFNESWAAAAQYRGVHYLDGRCPEKTKKKHRWNGSSKDERRAAVQMRKEDEWMFPLLGTNISHPQGIALEGTVDVSGASQ